MCSVLVRWHCVPLWCLLHIHISEHSHWFVRPGVELNGIKIAVPALSIFIVFVVIFLIIETIFGITIYVRDIYFSLLFGWTV